ncbi:hypothetical protein [Apilactobacillus quenuiae]|uniref:hypothetical protein n=1 Tax=Apilactobacillus quenuiae TaxID=2008377 RepID=UPI000D013FC9|nr:hypothetical protein [Apilactobacillus quenuiae]
MFTNISNISVKAKHVNKTIPHQLLDSTWIQSFKNPKFNGVYYIRFNKHVVIQGLTQSDSYSSLVDSVYKKGSIYFIKTHENLTHSKYTYKIKKKGKRIFLYYTDSSNNTKSVKYFYTKKNYLDK